MGLGSILSLKNFYGYNHKKPQHNVNEVNLRLKCSRLDKVFYLFKMFY